MGEVLQLLFSLKCSSLLHIPVLLTGLWVEVLGRYPLYPAWHSFRWSVCSHSSSCPVAQCGIYLCAFLSPTFHICPQHVFSSVVVCLLQFCWLSLGLWCLWGQAFQQLMPLPSVPWEPQSLWQASGLCSYLSDICVSFSVSLFLGLRWFKNGHHHHSPFPLPYLTCWSQPAGVFLVL